MTAADAVRLAHAGGLNTIAITDHDAVGGIEEAARLARELDVHLIPGAELTATTQDHEIHLLAYFQSIDSVSGSGERSLRAFLAEVQALRRKRVIAAIQALRIRGVLIKESDVFQPAACESYGRLHIARALVRTGYVGSENEAFSSFLNDKSGLVPRLEIEPETVIELVHGLGGLVVWAHPEKKEFDRYIDDLIAAGIDGVETHNFRQRDRVGSLSHEVKRRGLLATGGSDWHGGAYERALGSDALDDSIAVPFLEALSARGTQ